MKISVLTPTLNAAPYIRKAIESVLSQDYHDFEHIIIDGKSTDGTVEILKQYPHLIWISEPDKGQSDAMNKAFKFCKGEVIVYLNSDDWFEHETFIEVEKLFNQNPDVNIIVGNLYIRAINNPLTRLLITEYLFKRIAFPFRYEYPYNPVSYFYKREVQLRVGDFPIEDHFTMDYWFILRAFYQSSICKTGKVFGTFYDTGSNKTLFHKLNATCLAKIFIRQTNIVTKIYFWSHYLQYKMIIKPIQKVINLIKYLLYILITFHYIPFKKFNIYGFRKSLNSRH